MKDLDLTLYVVSDKSLAGTRGIFTVCEQALDAGATVVQLRDKDASFSSLVEQGRTLRALADRYRAVFIVNDRPHVAAACGAHGVHLGLDDAPLAAARAVMGPEAIIGISVQTPDQARSAERAGADYLAANLVFATTTKTDLDKPIGLEGIKDLRAASELPLVAIGGINAGNTAEVIAAGADGVAVVSAVMAAVDVPAACRELLDAVRKGRSQRHGS
ncbi:MAG TPA: thiamine phosphate synthase [Myxococcota bacterium]|nr:thiamine phosphate synthase [Myxococcota bacterium]